MLETVLSHLKVSSEGPGPRAGLGAGPGAGPWAMTDNTSEKQTCFTQKPLRAVFTQLVLHYWTVRLA